MTILCIEPDAILAKAYKQTLSANSHNTVIVCAHGQAAIEHLDEETVDVIVMELQLAPLSGFAFLYELRSYEDLQHIPVIIYSSVPPSNFGSTKESWHSLGVEHYFYKGTDSMQKVASFIARLERS